MGADAVLWKVAGWLPRNRVGFRLLADSAGEDGGEGYVYKDNFDQNLAEWLADHRDDDPEVAKDLEDWVADLPWDDGLLRVFVWW